MAWGFLAVLVTAYACLLAGLMVGAALQSGGDFGVEYWLERYQTLIAAGLAVVAAFWAARPVYLQLGEIRSQVALQTYVTVRDLSIVLEDQRRLMLRTAEVARSSLNWERRLKEGNYDRKTILKVTIKIYGTLTDQLEELLREIEKSGVRKWGYDSVREARHKVETTVATLRLGRVCNLYSYMHARFVIAAIIVWLIGRACRYVLAVTLCSLH